MTIEFGLLMKVCHKHCPTEELPLDFRLPWGSKMGDIMKPLNQGGNWDPNKPFLDIFINDISSERHYHNITTGSLRVRARFDNPGETLFPNQFVNTPTCRRRYWSNCRWGSTCCVGIPRST